MKLMIREYRQAAGMSQRELAAMIGVTQGAIHQWEAGKTMPMVGKLFAIAEALGCNVDDLIKKERCPCAPATTISP